MLSIRPISESLRKIVQDELNEDERRLPDDITALRDWIEKQPHLRARSDDQTLLTFLRGCKHSLEKAKSKIDHYYTIKTMVPEMFKSNIMDEKNLEFCRTGAYLVLPKPMGEAGPRLRLTSYPRMDQKKFSMNDMYRYELLVGAVWALYEDDNAVISGAIEIIDLSKMSLGYLAQFDPILIKKLATFSDKAAPIRFKGVHMFNVPKEAYTIINLARGLLSEKLQKRFYIHKTVEDLYEHIPKEYLPVEYGGSQGTMDEIQAENEKRLMELNNYWQENDKYGVDEKLRPGRKIDMDSLFGIEGTFRKLNID